MKPEPPPPPLDQCLRISAAHARLRLVLDEELGTYHGLSYADFLLLHRLACAQDQRLPLAELAPALGLRPSALLRQILPLEKTGLLGRDAETIVRGRRDVCLRSAARQIVSNASDTAQAVCERLAPSLGIVVAAQALAPDRPG